MSRIFISACFYLVFLHVAAAETHASQCVFVTDAYLELHTGPADVYPITQVVERNERVCVIRSRTKWIKVTSDRNREGWVHRDLLLAATAPIQDGSSAKDLD